MLTEHKQTETNHDLWKYFIDDAAKIKTACSIAPWMFTSKEVYFETFK